MFFCFLNFLDIANLEKPEFVPEFLGSFEFMYTNFVETIFRGSWRYQFFETKLMGVAEKNYELYVAKKTRLSVNKFKKMDMANLEKPELAPDFLGNLKFMEANFVETIFPGSWQYQFFETKPMGITEKNYELIKKNGCRSKVKKDMGNLDKPELAPEF